MRSRVTISRWIPALTLVVACVDPIHFDVTTPESLIILDGSITDDAGPYTITISRGLRLDSDTTKNEGVTGAKIMLLSDKGEAEPFVETGRGEYKTGGVIRGSIGTSYHIIVQMADGGTFESEPETIMPAGTIQDIRYQFEHRTVKKLEEILRADVFNIFVDANANSTEEGSTFVRWRMTGTYKVGTNPETHKTWIQGEFYYKTPFECSGYVVDPAIPGGVLRQATECTCCSCWIKQYESIPRLSDSDLVEGGAFRNLKVGEVPITRATFFEKYLVQIEQMTISKNAFNFFNIIRAQKEGAASLFQPTPGVLKGNIKPVKSDYEIIGLFWASSSYKKSIFIHESDVPYLLPVDDIPYPCTQAYANSTTVKPQNWDE